MDRIGTEISSFTIVAKGGPHHNHADRYRARDERTNRDVLLTVHRDASVRTDFRDEFSANRKALVGVRGRHLSGVVAASGVDNETAQIPGPPTALSPGPQLVWEAWDYVPVEQPVPGAEPKRWVPESPRPHATLVGVLQFAVDLAAGLETFHKSGQAHGGVSPASAIKHHEGHYVLLPPEWPPPSATRAARDPYFASTEELRHLPLVLQSDFSSLGATIHALLDGGTGYEHIDVLDLVTLERARGQVTWRRDGVPASVTQLVARMTSGDLCSRPASAAELRAELSELIAQAEGIAPLPPPPPQKVWCPPERPLETPEFISPDAQVPRAPWWRRLFRR